MEVINEAIGNATQDGAAKVIVNETFFALLDSSVDYELCVVSLLNQFKCDLDV
jgi:hypothetical protein